MYNFLMASSVDIIRRRRHRRERRDRSTAPAARRGFLSLFSVLAVALGIAGIGLTVVYNGLTDGLPSLDVLPGLLDPQTGLPANPTILYDRTGTIPLQILGARAPEGAYLSIGSQGIEGPEILLIDAMIAAADPGFWTHPGVKSRDLFDSEPDTIPWKLVSELLFWSDPPGLPRTLREKLLATQVVAEFGREQVLEWYLNAADFGNEAFGAEAAARLYYGKSAAVLTLPEAAALAALPRRRT